MLQNIVISWQLALVLLYNIHKGRLIWNHHMISSRVHRLGIITCYYLRTEHFDIISFYSQEEISSLSTHGIVGACFMTHRTQNKNAQKTLYPLLNKITAYAKIAKIIWRFQCFYCELVTLMLDIACLAMFAGNPRGTCKFHSQWKLSAMKTLYFWDFFIYFGFRKR